MDLKLIQLDVIYKALHYTCAVNGVDVPEELQEVYGVLAEENPNETHAEDGLHIMELIAEHIKGSEPYCEYFEKEPEYYFEPVQTADGSIFYRVLLDDNFVCYMENKDIAQVDKYLEQTLHFNTRQDFIDSFLG